MTNATTIKSIFVFCSDTALSIASANGHGEIVSMLLQAVRSKELFLIKIC